LAFLEFKTLKLEKHATTPRGHAGLGQEEEEEPGGGGVDGLGEEEDSAPHFG